MDLHTHIALFGEAEKGHYHTAYFCDTLPELVDYLGNPPGESSGLFFAIQALLYNHPLVYFRVNEEGFSPKDYFESFEYLKKKNLTPIIRVLCLPGVGDRLILDATAELLFHHGTLLITTEADLYDYLTARS